MSEERRIVTVLFADVSGSTELGELLDPEDVRALLGRYYTIARGVVEAYGGTLEKFIGDAVMAIFGFPRAHDDDACRALAAAIDLRDRVRADPTLTDRLRIRCGVNTGEVVASRDPTAADFLVTGDAVNVAARLQQAAEPWAILCGERTVSAARPVFEFGPAADVDARGKRLPIRACLLLGRAVKPIASSPPLIGRDHDLAQLELVARRVLEEHRPFLVTITAPAGLGKTRLLEEFLRRWSEVAPRTTVAVAQCLPYGQHLTYWPLRAVLFRLVGLQDDTRPEDVSPAVEAWLRDSGVASPRRAAELLAATIGAGNPEVSERSELFAAWRTALEVSARRAPLVLVIEDLHWSSDTLLDVFEFLMQPATDLPALIVALTRPEILERRPHWGGGRRNYVSLSLEPLRDGAIAELVGYLTEAMAAEIVDRIVARADGNPFYAGEMVRSVVERAAASDDSGAVERALATLPDTVQATVLARLDLLPADERRVMQLGSVFGRTFRPTGVAALDPNLSPDVERLVEALSAKDLLRPAGADGYAYRHILFREVAYQTLPRAERARLHAGAARWLEQTTLGREHENAELIAYHYQEAVRLLGAVGTESLATDDLRDKAVHWLVRAADVAIAAAATREGVRHLRAAIALAERPDLPALYERLGDCLFSGDDAVEAYRTALRLGRDYGLPPDDELRTIASMLIVYTRFKGSVSNHPTIEEIQHLRAAGHALVNRATDEYGIASFFVAEGFLPFWHDPESPGTIPSNDDLGSAETAIQKAIEIARRLASPKLLSAALDALAGCAQVRGAWAESRAFARQRLEFAERLDLYELGDAYAMVVWTSVVLGDLEEANQAVVTGLSRIQPGQAVGVALHLMVWRMVVARILGEWDAAIACGDRARQLWIGMGRPATSFSLRGFIAALDVARARRDERRVAQYEETIKAILSSLPATSNWKAWSDYLAGDLAGVEAQLIHHLPLSHRGVDHLEQLLALCCDGGRPPPLDAARLGADFAAGHGYRLLEAQALRAIGLSRQDPEALAHSLQIWEEVNAVPYAARVRCELALLTGDDGELDRGRAVLARLGDLEQLARLDRLRYKRGDETGGRSPQRRTRSDE